LARQMPPSFSAEGVSVSIYRAAAPASIPGFRDLVARCDKLANQGRFG
jgi:hypothetical protein